MLDADRVVYNHDGARAVLLHARLRRPFVHGMPDRPSGTRLQRARARGVNAVRRRAQLHAARVVVAPSHFVADRLPAPARVIPSSVRTDVFRDLDGPRHGVVFAGRIDHGKGLETLLGVVPSTGPEAFGIVGLELQAAGCAVVASAAGGIPEALGDGALLTPAGGVEELAEALAEALCSDETRRRVTAAGTANAARFGPAVMAERYRDLLLDPTIW